MSVRLTIVFAAALALAACETTGTVGLVEPGAHDRLERAPAPTDARTPDPKDDTGLAQLYFREKSFGLAEQHFRKAVEKTPENAEAWLGLAASYDQLRRFPLADRAYRQALRFGGPSPEVYNNRGYSHLMRGDLAKARDDFAEAHRLAPEEITIANNLKLLQARLAGLGR